LGIEMSSTDMQHGSDRTLDYRADGLPYYRLNYFYRKKFGAKVWKLSLDAGCGCPNRDGTLATLGCIYCSPESFSPSRRMGTGSIAEQAQEGIRRLKRRYAADRFVAYFQAGTNTYGPIDRLRLFYQQAIAHPDVVGLAIGTRPDCVSEEILDLLAELANQTWVVVEYGLQSIHDRTLDRLNRGHHYDAFLDAHRRTCQRNLDMGVHVILGLPGESAEDMRATARELARLKIHSIKLHNLYAVRNTVLAEQLAAGQVRLLDLEEYVGHVVDFLEELPGNVVIERLCGDAPPEYLLGPSWCLNKAAVRSAVEEEFRRRGTFQGFKAGGNE
jgi:radical SAM protein (TIGR01212 family)